MFVVAYGLMAVAVITLFSNMKNTVARGYAVILLSITGMLALAFGSLSMYIEKVGINPSFRTQLMAILVSGGYAFGILMAVSATSAVVMSFKFLTSR